MASSVELDGAVAVGRARDLVALDGELAYHARLEVRGAIVGGEEAQQGVVAGRQVHHGGGGGQARTHRRRTAVDGLVGRFGQSLAASSSPLSSAVRTWSRVTPSCRARCMGQHVGDVVVVPEGEGGGAGRRVPDTS